MKDKEKGFDTKYKILPVILSGGTGTRLWPLSRACYPKQYLNLIENNEYSLLQNTYLRLKGLKNMDSPLIICNEEQRFIVAEQMREIKVKPKSVLLEPFGRNTAPAITLAALLANRFEYDPILLVLSSDHIISDNKKFKQRIEEGISEANKGNLITFGVIATNPETGYGYIEAYEYISKNINVSKIKQFIEKPKKEDAIQMIKDKRFTWNSGIFLFRASAFLDEIRHFEPEIFSICEKSIEDSCADLDFLRISGESFKKCKNISIDYAVMEKTQKGYVVNLDSGWSDVGSWKSVWENSPKDENGNSLRGKVILKDVKESYVRSQNRLIMGVSLENLIIVDTDDAILIANKNSSEKIKTLVSEIKNKNFPEANINRKVFRPWGNYISIKEGLNWQVKRLEIKPHSKLSLQMHKCRSEHWVIVSGSAKVEINSKTSFLKKNESIFVPLGSKHRLSNPNNDILILIEVQIGSYLGEDDIIRFDDMYGRNISKQ